ncbi:MAG TPA: hypothetical protein VEB19_12280 [Gemmatimonadaceae bacterium]|nr:hypothetical protein [Gemmatimonadaceae bacterium]
MKRPAVALLASALVVVSCLNVEDRPALSLLANANALTLTTDDTLVIFRAITNSGKNDMWLNAAADAFEMTNANGTKVCDASAILALAAPDLVRVPTGQGVVNERKFALSDLPNCAPGNYSLVFVAHFRPSETAADNFTLRTSSAPFALQAAP